MFYASVKFDNINKSMMYIYVASICNLIHDWLLYLILCAYLAFCTMPYYNVLHYIIHSHIIEDIIENITKLCLYSTAEEKHIAVASTYSNYNCIVVVMSSYQCHRCLPILVILLLLFQIPLSLLILLFILLLLLLLATQTEAVITGWYHIVIITLDVRSWL